MLLVIAAVGCKTRRYEVLTRLEPDGTFRREIYQPLDDSLPPEALAEAETTGPASRPAEFRLDDTWKARWMSVRTAPAPPDAQDGPYFRAVGEFAKAANIPPSYFAAGDPPDDLASENLLSHAEEDYGIFGIDQWTETITETVLLPEYAEAVGDTLEMLMPAFKAALEESYGQRYELKPLLAYLDGQATRALRNYCLWFYQYRPHSMEDISGDALHDLQSVLEPAGLQLPEDEDHYIDQEALGEELDAFFLDLVQAKVRMRPSGRALTDEEAEALWRRIRVDCGLPATPQGMQEEDEQPTVRPTSDGPQTRPAQQERFWEAVSRHFMRLYGAHGERELQRLRIKMGGVHGHSPFDLLLGGMSLNASRSFRYTLELPGPVLETDGRRIDERTIRWDFTDVDLFPSGFTMTAMSIRWRPHVERRLFGRRVLQDLAGVARLLDAVPAGGPVQEALIDAARRGTLAPLRELLDDEDEGVRAGAKAVLDLGSTGSPETRP